MIKKDVIIIGGGPAGSSCALKLKEYGFDTLILDKHEFPRLIVRGVDYASGLSIIEHGRIS